MKKDDIYMYISSFFLIKSMLIFISIYYVNKQIK